MYKGFILLYFRIRVRKSISVWCVEQMSGGFVQIVELSEDASLGGTTVARVDHTLDKAAQLLEHS